MQIHSGRSAGTLFQLQSRASCTQTTFSNATTCHVSQTNECTLTEDKARFMAIVICIAQRWKPVFVQ
ncbi:hypothetical protein T06_4984 [Trichinella sp. T6]|nr:hypothetical protein T06_4984 [Trichinella sp. T6]